MRAGVAALPLARPEISLVLGPQDPDDVRGGKTARPSRRAATKIGHGDHL